MFQHRPRTSVMSPWRTRSLARLARGTPGYIRQGCLGRRGVSRRALREKGCITFKMRPKTDFLQDLSLLPN